MAAVPDRPRPVGPIRISHVLGFLAVSLLHAQTPPNLIRLASQISGADPASTASLLKIFEWGSRPWEAIAAPVVVEQRDAARNVARTFFFALESGDLTGNVPRLPRSNREESFARAVEKILKSEGEAPWPVFVFSAGSGELQALDAFSLATTRRIFVREAGGPPQPASAILLNSAYWGTAGAVPGGAPDRLTEIAAKHEIYHARRAWLRANETAAHTDAIEARLHEAGIHIEDRTHLETLVRQGIVAWEEVEAVDRSLAGLALPTYRRQSFIEYRERNRDLHRKVVRQCAGLFTGVAEGRERKELEQWLADLLRKDLRPLPR